MELPVDIGQTDFIIIHQHEMPHTSPGQPFGYEGAYAAYAKDSDSGRRQPCQPFPSQEQLGTGKSMY